MFGRLTVKNLRSREMLRFSFNCATPEATSIERRFLELKLSISTAETPPTEIQLIGQKKVAHLKYTTMCHISHQVHLVSYTPPPKKKRNAYFLLEKSCFTHKRIKYGCEYLEDYLYSCSVVLTLPAKNMTLMF